MSSAAGWLGDGLAYGVQVTALLAAGIAVALFGRVREPRVALAYWQALLAAALLLPLLPWPAPAAGLGVVPVFVPSGARAAGASGGAFGPWMAAVLAAGAALRWLRVGAGLVRLRHFSWNATPLAPPEWLRAMARRLGVAPRYALSDDIDVPATFGLRRPLVLLPREWARLAPERQRDSAAHELLHVRRRDWLPILAEELVSGLFWFHPGVAWVVARIRLAREQVVDQGVVRLTGARDSYLETLLAAAGAQARAPLAAPSFLRAPQLTRRIDLLLKEAHMSRAKIVAVLLSGAGALALAGAGAAWTFPLRAGADTAGAEKTVSGPRPVHRVNAVYPAQAKKDKVQGDVVLAIQIEPSGAVTHVVAVSGPTPLHDAAADAVRQWRFEPGGAVSKATITVRFTVVEDE